MTALRDLTGQKFGKLLVLERVEDYVFSSGRKCTRWLCQCDCGEKVFVNGNALVTGNTISCGCSRYAETLVGQRFGKLFVLDRVKKQACSSGNKSSKFLCQCDCGNIVEVRRDHLLSGRTSSCGCNSHPIKHGLLKSRLYGIWVGMKNRCYNINSTYYKNYGGRGITICDDWHYDFISFYNWSIANGYSDDLSIDRIDVNGNYEPSNCRWVTDKVQGRNRRNNIYITYNDVTKTLAEWAELTGINYNTLYHRIHYYGWSIEKAFETK